MGLDSSQVALSATEPSQWFEHQLTVHLDQSAKTFLSHQDALRSWAAGLASKSSTELKIIGFPFGFDGPH